MIPKIKEISSITNSDILRVSFHLDVGITGLVTLGWKERGKSLQTESRKVCEERECLFSFFYISSVNA